MRKKLKNIIFIFVFFAYQVFKIKTLLKIFHIQIKGISKIIKTKIDGHIKLGNKSKLKKSSLFGKINIQEYTFIENSFLNGEIEIGLKSIVKNSNIQGVFRVGTNAFMENISISGNVNIGNNFKVLGTGVVLRGNIEVGNYTSFNGPNTDVRAGIHNVKIGNFCSIARNVTIQEYNHKTNRVSSYFMSQNVFRESMLNDINSKGNITIENDVWIGTHCVILSGSHISTGAAIAANSIVSGYIPPYAIAGGNPAKVLKSRFSESQIKQLLDLKWWEWDIEKIKRNKDFFLSDEMEIRKVVD